MKRLGGVGIFLVCGLLGSASSLHAQPADTAVSDSQQQAQPADTTVSILQDSAGNIVATSETPVTVAPGQVDESKWPDPTLCLFKSMLVPGWGQITNKAYFKAGLAIGLEAWFLTNAIIYNGKMNDALDAYHADPNNTLHFYDYQQYQGLRSDYLWGLGITVFISMFDAYVDAHLRPYDDDTIPGVEPPKGLILDIPF